MKPLAATFAFPTTTLFGVGALEHLPSRLEHSGWKHPLVVTEPGLLKTRAFDLLSKALDAASPKLSWNLFSGVHPNPVEQDVVDTAAAFRAAGCDSVIAFGGGSALDVGKAARLLLKKPSLMLAEFDFTDDWSGLPGCVCIPTTAGTGSEVGRSSVITLASTGRKAVLFHPGLLAALVILDPELTRDLPPGLTAATGMDALTHCLEAFTSPAFHPLCDGIALEGIHLIAQALRRAYRNGSDLDARGDMLVAAAMGAIAFQKDLGATHSMAHPLSTVCGVHHGTANAVCLPAVMEFNARAKPGLYRRIGVALGLDLMKAADADADASTVQAIRSLIADTGLAGGLRRFGVDESHIEVLSAQAVEDGCHKTNPVPVTRDDFLALFKASL